MGFALDLLQHFLLAGAAFFSIINPIAGALIFAQATADRGNDDRRALARRVGAYAAAVMLVSLWFGAGVLAFFGITIAALKIGGGLVVAASAWRMLSAPQAYEDRKHSQADDARGSPDIAFYPLTMPLTTGPGTIAVAIALGANRPAAGVTLAAFAVGASLAAIANAVAIWLAYSWSDWITGLLGPGGVRVIGRLAAFILLCVGVQITLNGALDVFRMAGIGRPA